MKIEMHQYIQNGVRLLDERGPHDWRERLLNWPHQIDLNDYDEDILFAIYQDPDQALLDLDLGLTYIDDWGETKPDPGCIETTNALTQHGLYYEHLTETTRTPLCEHQELIGRWLAIAAQKQVALTE